MTSGAVARPSLRIGANCPGRPRPEKRLTGVTDMYEKEKIIEAEYFYSRMLQEQNDRHAFRHNLSAFLSAARSVLQYALKESENKTAGKQWYDTQVSSCPALKSFKDKRDINIHASPVEFKQRVNVTINETVFGIASVSVIVRDKNGNIKSQSAEEPPTTVRAPETSPIVTHHFFFDDWSGDEDIFMVSQTYLDNIKSIVEDGLQKRFLS
jgi:hypothetical protein